MPCDGSNSDGLLERGWCLIDDDFSVSEHWRPRSRTRPNAEPSRIEPHGIFERVRCSAKKRPHHKGENNAFSAVFLLNEMPLNLIGEIRIEDENIRTTAKIDDNDYDECFLYAPVSHGIFSL